MEKCQKHEIVFVEVAETFSDPAGFRLRDMKHSAMEAKLFF
jgi:uncharacterized DUF497 family protein